jgi:uncharacterized membrane protein
MAAAAAGAGLAYLFDPDRGRRRRALARDQLGKAARRATDAARVTRRDLAHRAQGTVARTRRRLDRSVPDAPTLVARVRSELGRVTRQVGAIEVDATDGHVTLRGDVLRRDHARVVRATRRVPGVRHVDDRLAIHETPGDVPGLQGASARQPEPRAELLQERWAPGIRAMGAAAGALATGRGLRRGGVGGLLLAGAGLTTVARAVTNLPVTRLLGLAGRRAVDVCEAIEIDAPVDEVWAAFEPTRLPELMTHVRDVRVVDGNRTHWTVEGPLGTTVEWDAVETVREPGARIAWKTCEGSTVEHAGVVRFERRGDRRTRVDVRLSYDPVAGAAGHAVASLLGADPHRQLRDDLMRLKTALETGTRAHDAARSS